MILQTPRVSVVTIFCNAERFLEEAIASVLEQSFEDWELILVDDGSKDRSTEIAHEFTAQNPARIRYVDHPGHENRGMSASRNHGVDQARGDWIALLDADDVWLPEKLEEQLALLKEEPRAAMVYGRTLYWWEWAGTDSRRQDRIQSHGISGNTLYEPPELLRAYLRGRAAIPCTCSVLARRGAVEEVGGFDDRFTGLYEDQVFYAKMSAQYAIFVAERWWDKYRQHQESAWQSADRAEERAARLVYLEWLERYLSGGGWEDASLMRAVRMERYRARLPILGRTIKALRGLYGFRPRQLPVTTPRKK